MPAQTPGGVSGFVVEDKPLKLPTYVVGIWKIMDPCYFDVLGFYKFVPTLNSLGTSVSD